MLRVDKTKTMKLVSNIHRATHVAIAPVRYAVRHIPCPRRKRHVKILIGVGIMLVGSTMATNPVTFIPHVVWDAMAYGLHGYGALPIIKILCVKLDLEHLDE
jgi:hypothetical protein